MTGESDPIRRVLGRLGLLDFDGLEREAAAAAAAHGPDHTPVVARLLVASLDAHHQAMVRRLAAEVGRGILELNELRHGVGLGPRRG